MPGVAVTPVPIVSHQVVCVPPSGPVSPVPRAMPCVPIRTPEPIVYQRTVNIYRFDDVGRTVHVLIAYDLNAYLIRLVFLYVDRGYVLIDIFRQDSLQYYQAFVT